MPLEIDHTELRSEHVQEVLTTVPIWMIRWGNTLFLVLLLLLFAMSWFIKYPDVIMSQALITTKIPPQKVFAMSTGRLDEILVSDHEEVAKSQPLAIIENTSQYKDILLLKQVVDTITVRKTGFDFPLDSLPVLFLGEIDAPFALFGNHYFQYQLNKELQPFSNESLANQYSISELNRRLQSLKSQRDINQAELDYKNKDLQRSRTLFDKGVISAQAYENKQLEYAQTVRNYKNYETSISQTKEAISNAHNVSKNSEIGNVKTEKMLLKNVIQSFNQLKKAIKDWEQKYVLQSKINGRVSFLKYYSTSQTVNQGDVVFTVIPADNSLYIAKLKTPARNSGKIKRNQIVNIRLDNYPDSEFGILKGVVTHISSLPDENGFYLVDVALPKTLITSYKKEVEFKQEMLGSAEIITEDLRLIERFFYQLKDVLNR